MIVKLASTVLTPEKPDYPRGKWYVEGLYQQLLAVGYFQLELGFYGMRNEKAVSSFMCEFFPCATVGLRLTAP